MTLLQGVKAAHRIEMIVRKYVVFIRLASFGRA